MRNTLAFLGALVLAVAGAGWYLGWYQVFFAPGRGGHETVKIDINTDKVSADLKKGKDEVLNKGGEKLHNLLETGKGGGGAKTDGDKSTSMPPLSFGVSEEQEAPPPKPLPPGGVVGGIKFTIPDKDSSPPPPPLPTPFGGATGRQ
jgi:hypothetical protein